MLFPQVPHALREKVSAEIGFNVGLVSGKLGSEVGRFEDVVTRLQVIERYLQSTNAIGTVALPQDWFAGEMMAKTIGLWTRGGAVFFLGETARTFVALGGSARNLLGGNVSSGEGPPYSNLAPMLEALEEVVMSETMESSDRLRRGQSDPMLEAPLTWQGLVQALEQNSRAVAERVHFVARRLLGGKLEDQRVILATPLYVASGPASVARA